MPPSSEGQNLDNHYNEKPQNLYSRPIVKVIRIKKDATFTGYCLFDRLFVCKAGSPQIRRSTRYQNLRLFNWLISYSICRLVSGFLCWLFV
jgi:hypothetical protein